MLLCSIAHSIICTRLFRGKMHSDWFIGIEILQGRWQHAEKVGYCYPGGLEKTLCKWDIYVPLVTKGLIISDKFYLKFYHYQFSLISNAANYNTVILDNSLLQTVTIPEAAYIQLRRRPPEDEQDNARNM